MFQIETHRDFRLKGKRATRCCDFAADGEEGCHFQSRRHQVSGRDDGGLVQQFIDDMFDLT